MMTPVRPNPAWQWTATAPSVSAKDKTFTISTIELILQISKLKYFISEKENLTIVRLLFKKFG